MVKLSASHVSRAPEFCSHELCAPEPKIKVMAYQQESCSRDENGMTMQSNEQLATIRWEENMVTEFRRMKTIAISY